MKKLMILSILAAIAMPLMADEATAEVSKPAELNEEDAGYLYTPKKGPQILIWDARTNANERVLNRFLKTNDPANLGAPGLPVETEKTPLAEGACPFASASEKLSKDISLVVMIYDGGEKTPRLSVFPEDRVALINSDRLSPILREKLLVREISRAIGFTGGTGYAQYRGCVMQPAFSEAEIAALMGDVLQPMTLQNYKKFENRYGMKRTRLVSYEVACYEGWAPEPTNEVQKVIWTEVKDELSKAPTKPIRIQRKK